MWVTPREINLARKKPNPRPTMMANKPTPIMSFLARSAFACPVSFKSFATSRAVSTISSACRVAAPYLADTSVETERAPRSRISILVSNGMVSE